VYLVIVGIVTMIGLVIWDRRTALAPAVREQARITTALKELAATNPEVANALRHAGLL
jgi:hypothetical protein